MPLIVGGGCGNSGVYSVATTSSSGNDEAMDGGGDSTDLLAPPITWNYCWQQGLDYDASTCSCAAPASPVVIDIAGDGFRLTDAESGVLYFQSSQV